MSNYKINRNRPKPDSDTVKVCKDFGSVLDRVKSTVHIKQKPFYKKNWFYTSVVVATIAISVLVYKSAKKSVAPLAKKQTETSTTANSDFTRTFVNPPLKGIDVPFDTYKVDVKSGGEITHKTGSKLKISKDAFVDLNGKIVNGDVIIKYREFHDPIDFFVSGIPMTYDSGGTKYIFESAGMMEIQGYDKDGNKVNIKPGNPINVEMASNFEGTKYNLYRLDTAARNWIYLGKDKVTSLPKKMRPKQEQDARIVRKLTPKEEKEEKITFITQETLKREKEINAVKKTIDTLKTAIAKAETKLPPKPKRINKSNYHFELEVDRREFPELAMYDKIGFEVHPKNKNFTRQIYNTTWDDAELKERSKGDSCYVMSLKKGAEKHEFTVYPVFSDANINAALTMYTNANKEQLGKIASLKNALALNEKKKEEYVENKNRFEYEYEQKRSLNAANQDQIYLREGKKIAEANKVQESAYASLTGNNFFSVKREFPVTTFAVYNCDHPLPPLAQRLAERIEVLKNQKVYKDFGVTSFTDEEENKLLFYSLTLIQKDVNAIFPQNNYYAIRYHTEKQNMLLGSGYRSEDSSIVVALCSYDDFEKMVGNMAGNQSAVKMKVFDSKTIKSLEDLKKGIDL